ncbi:hypothetical protein [Bordetella hinzii]|uniref:hypothetical protein n=1 Tax=Bordetella hinzii TaxID=103855 RepID=UPI000F6B6783|nr:hypothetical protein [Bordetella hinzii]VEH25715.1 Uncharacterised protein [Bordetella hinzii]VEH25716.1 Uncharacterised protein [Bordetella hinzii]VEH25717.1 Uncharacterised protein [Bordetella hinzii]VEH25718.1 Uncharacterised protein [Bordetella hinzii]VEH25719.1 Uncharacterised protein [Bordetella hinzii]
MAKQMIDSQALIALQVDIERARILSKLRQCASDELDESERDELSFMIIDALSKVDTDLSAAISGAKKPAQEARHG